jgi:hypothetical protein
MVACPECSDDFHSLSQHWAMSDCGYPRFTEKQWNVVVGLMMGDGSLNYGKKNPILQIQCTNKEYLEYLDELFACLGNGVKLVKTSEESATAAIDGGLRPHADAGNYADVYGWYSRTHPCLNELDWYGEHGKVWPEDIELAPETLKHWYCGDGTWNNNGDCNHIQIAMSNEIEHTEKVTSLFEKADLPSPYTYSTYTRDSGKVDCLAQFRVSDSKELWEYMGPPSPGFEYKWPEIYH